MTEEITEFNHPDSIWTWKTAKGRKKATLWLPYFQSVERAKPRSKMLYRFIYNGGDFEADLRKIDCIMIYGATGTLPISFLDSLSVLGIHLLIHRRGMPQPYVFLPAQGSLSKDTLTAQVAIRRNTNKRVYIARTIIKERLKTLTKQLPVLDTVFSRLAKSRDLAGKSHRGSDNETLLVVVLRKYRYPWFSAARQKLADKSGFRCGFVFHVWDIASVGDFASA